MYPENSEEPLLGAARTVAERMVHPKTSGPAAKLKPKSKPATRLHEEPLPMSVIMEPILGFRVLFLRRSHPLSPQKTLWVGDLGAKNKI